MRKRQAFHVILALMALAGCSSPSSRSNVDSGHDSREALVLEVLPPGVPPKLPQECKALLTAEQSASARFVIVRYLSHRRAKERLAELLNDIQVAVGDKVELWPGDCARKGQIAQVPRILSPESSQIQP